MKGIVIIAVFFLVGLETGTCEAEPRYLHHLHGVHLKPKEYVYAPKQSGHEGQTLLVKSAPKPKTKYVKVVNVEPPQEKVYERPVVIEKKSYAPAAIPVPVPVPAPAPSEKLIIPQTSTVTGAQTHGSFNQNSHVYINAPQTYQTQVVQQEQKTKAAAQPTAPIVHHHYHSGNQGGGGNGNYYPRSGGADERRVQPRAQPPPPPPAPVVQRQPEVVYRPVEQPQRVVHTPVQERQPTMVVEQPRPRVVARPKIMVQPQIIEQPTTIVRQPHVIQQQPPMVIAPQRPQIIQQPAPVFQQPPTVIPGIPPIPQGFGQLPGFFAQPQQPHPPMMMPQMMPQMLPNFQPQRQPQNPLMGVFSMMSQLPFFGRGGDSSEEK